MLHLRFITMGGCVRHYQCHQCVILLLLLVYGRVFSPDYWLVLIRIVASWPFYSCSDSVLILDAIGRMLLRSFLPRVVSRRLSPHSFESHGLQPCVVSPSSGLLPGFGHLPSLCFLPRLS